MPRRSTGWFARHGLRREDCRAAVVVPAFSVKAGYKERWLADVCAEFDVELIQVSPEDAHLGGAG